jgi:cytoskeletal protein RodZ
MPPVNDEDGRLDWHDHPGVIWAAGVAALALVGLLVYVVIRVSGGSSLLPGDAPPATSYATTSSSTGSSTTTSYTVPSVQTSEDTGAPVTGPPPEASTETAPTETTTSTTIYNPYSSTTPTNAGHI